MAEPSIRQGFSSRSFLRKGRTLRKKCAQVKVLEKYLHESSRCGLDTLFQGRSKATISAASHVVIPSVECLLNFLPVLKQLPVVSVQNQVLLLIQTCLKVVLESATAQQRREYKGLLFDFPSAARMVFLNEVLNGISTVQGVDEPFSEYSKRLFVSACIFLADITSCTATVLLSDDLDPMKSDFYPPEIRVKTVREFVEDTPALATSTLLLEIDEILDTLKLTRASAAALKEQKYSFGDEFQSEFVSSVVSKPSVYRPHLSLSALKQGIAAGTLVKGKFYVYRHNTLEGEVEDASRKSITIVSGRKDMNRALDGDEVVVQLYSRDMWRRPIEMLVLSAPSEETGDGDNDDDDNDDDAGDADLTGEGNQQGDTAPAVLSLSAAARRNKAEKEKAAKSKKRQQVEAAEELALEAALGVYDSEGYNLTPMGFIVGVLRREAAEIVATIPISKDTPSDFSRASNIIADATSTAAGILTSVVTDKEEYLLIPPADRKIPKIRIRTRQHKRLAGQRVVVVIDNWEVDSAYPNGHLVRVIGDANDWTTEIDSLLMKHSIFPRPFSAAALACLPQVPNLKALPSCAAVVVAVPASVASANTEQSSPLQSSVSPMEQAEKEKKGSKKGAEWIDSQWNISEEQIAEGSRVDWRKSHRIFSVDPPGCQDIDDAMGVRWVPGQPGMLEIVVCIADVCAFVPQGSALDTEAQTRATTVYLTHTRMDMLPALISGDVASLHGDKDRYAVAVTWHVKLVHTSTGKPLAPKEDPLLLDGNSDISFQELRIHSCGRVAIRSVAAMTYGQAHNLIFGREPDPPGLPTTVPMGQAGRPVAPSLWEGLRSDLKILTVFGRFLKASREAAGALDLSQGAGGELKFKLDTEGDPVEVQGKEELEVHNTIAELMILANSAVSEIIYSITHMETLMRIHPPPPQSKLQAVRELAQQSGLTVFSTGSRGEGGGGESSSDIWEQLRTFRGKLMSSSKLNKSTQDKSSIVDFVTSAVIKSMNEAKYVCSGSLSGDIFAGRDETAAEGRMMGHYGLGLKFYTHFTSPIRRYADIIVHRQLLAVLETLGNHSSYSNNSGCGSCALQEINLEDLQQRYKAEQDAIKENLSSLGDDDKIVSIPESALPELGDLVPDESLGKAAVHDVKAVKVADGRTNYEKVSSVVVSYPEPARINDNSLHQRRKAGRQQQQQPLEIDSTVSFPALGAATAANAVVSAAPASVPALKMKISAKQGGGGAGSPAVSPLGSDDLLDDLLAASVDANAATVASTTSITTVAANTTTISSSRSADDLLDDLLGDIDIGSSSLLDIAIKNATPNSLKDAITSTNHEDLLDDLLGNESRILKSIEEVEGIADVSSSSATTNIVTAAHGSSSHEDLLDDLLADIDGDNILIAGRANNKKSALLVGSYSSSAGTEAENNLLDELLDSVSVSMGQQEEQQQQQQKQQQQQEPVNPNHHNSSAATSTAAASTTAATAASSVVAVVSKERVSDPKRPYAAYEVSQISAHLNIMNRRSKAAQLECQQLFLRLYFAKRVEVHEAVVYALRANGFLAYVPGFDYKGPVYITNSDGDVVIDPSILGLPASSGRDPTQSKTRTSSSMANQYMGGAEDNVKQKQPLSLANRRLLDDYQCRLVKSSSIATPTAAAAAAASSSLTVVANKKQQQHQQVAPPDEGAGETLELLISPRRDNTPAAASISRNPLRSSIGNTIRIIPMQKVLVEITASGSDSSLRTPEIRLSLYKTTQDLPQGYAKNTTVLKKRDGNFISDTVMEEGNRQQQSDRRLLKKNIENIPPTSTTSPPPGAAHINISSGNNLYADIRHIRATCDSGSSSSSRNGAVSKITACALRYCVRSSPAPHRRERVATTGAVLSASDIDTDTLRTTKIIQASVGNDDGSSHGVPVHVEVLLENAGDDETNSHELPSVPDHADPDTRDVASSIVPDPVDPDTNTTAEDLTLIHRRSVKRRAKLCQLLQKKSLRHDIANTGRIAFGTENSVRPLYRGRAASKSAKCVDVSSSSSSSLSTSAQLLFTPLKLREEREDAVVRASLEVGRAAAMVKMQRWGEEWAEEEELPTSWEAGEGGGADTELGLAATAGRFGHEVQLATQRQAKLKIAKKRSKYDA